MEQARKAKMLCAAAAGGNVKAQPYLIMAIQIAVCDYGIADVVGETANALLSGWLAPNMIAALFKAALNIFSQKFGRCKTVWIA